MLPHPGAWESPCGRIHHWTARRGHPSIPRVLAQSENPSSVQRPRQCAQTKLPAAGNTGVTTKLGAVATWAHNVRR